MSSLLKHLNVFLETFGAEEEVEEVREGLLREMTAGEDEERETTEEELDKVFEAAFSTLRGLQEKGGDVLLAGLRETGPAGEDRVSTYGTCVICMYTCTCT